MLLPVTVITVTTRKAMERECAACGKKAVFPASRIRDTVWCADCGAAIPSKDQGRERKTVEQKVEHESRERSRSMFRTLQAQAERFCRRQPGLLMRIVRLKGLVITSILVLAMLLTVVMSLD